MRLFILLVLWCSSSMCFAAGPEFSNSERILRAKYDDFLKARSGQTVDPSLFGYVYTFDWSDKQVDEFRSEFLSNESRDRRSGVRLLKEGLDRIDFFKEGTREIGFLRVRSIYSHPMHPKDPEVVERTIHAISDDNGQSWKFNVMNCFSEEWVKRSFKKYQGAPSFY